MTIQNSSFSIIAGDAKRLNFSITDEAGAPLDITGAAFRFGISKRDTKAATLVPQGAALITKDNGMTGGITIVSAGSGTLRVDLASGDTTGFSGEHYFELEMTLGGDVSTLAIGGFTISKELLT